MDEKAQSVNTYKEADNEGPNEFESNNFLLPLTNYGKVCPLY